MSDALNALSGRFIPKSVTISLAGDVYGDAALSGAWGQSVKISGGGHTLYGSLDLDGTVCAVEAENLTINRPASSGNPYAVFARRCMGYVELRQCTLLGGETITVNIARGVRARMYACELRGAGTLIYLWHGSDLQTLNLRGGDCTNFLDIDGATARMGGTRPDGGWKMSNVSDVLPADPGALTIDYGSATPTAPTILTKEFAMQHTDSYSQYLKWEWVYTTHPTDDDDVMQGFTETISRARGCIWFDNAAIRSALGGKTINQATLRLHRMRGYGGSRAVDVHLYGTATEYEGRSGAPELTVDYGVIGQIAPNETLTITLPVQAAKDLASGAINGFTLYTGETAVYDGGLVSKNYARFAGETSGDAETKPVLTVTYQ